MESAIPPKATVNPRRDRHAPFRELGGDLQRAAKRLDVASQIADVHVGALLQLGHGRLLDLERASKLLLRALARLAQLGQRHLALELRDPLGNTSAALARELGGQLFEWPMSGHGMSPSRFNCAMC